MLILLIILKSLWVHGLPPSLGRAPATQGNTLGLGRSTLPTVLQQSSESQTLNSSELVSLFPHGCLQARHSLQELCGLMKASGLPEPMGLRRSGAWENACTAGESGPGPPSVSQVPRALSQGKRLPAQPSGHKAQSRPAVDGAHARTVGTSDRAERGAPSSAPRGAPARL